MDEFKVFTLNPEGFPLEKTRELVHHLHAQDQHYVMMVDPGKQLLHPRQVQKLTKLAAVAYQVLSRSCFDDNFRKQLFEYPPNASL